MVNRDPEVPDYAGDARTPPPHGQYRHLPIWGIGSPAPCWLSGAQGDTNERCRPDRREEVECSHRVHRTDRIDVRTSSRSTHQPDRP
jgi:hypothetical protein